MLVHVQSEHSSTAIERAHGTLAERIPLFLAALLFLLPFVWPVHRPPQPAFDVEWLAAVVLALAAVAVAVVPRRRIELQWPLPAWLALFAAAVALQFVAGWLSYRMQLAMAVLYSFAIFGAYALGKFISDSGQRSRSLRWICWSLLVGAAVSFLVQWLQIFGVKGLPWWLYFEIGDKWFATRPFGNIGQPNLLATYLTWATLAALYLAANGVRLVAAVPLVAITACGLALTGSRMGLLFFLVLAASLWIPWALRPADVRHRWLFSAAMVAGYFAGMLAVRLLISFDGQAFSTVLERVGDGTLGRRLLMWSHAWEVAKSAPLTGVGFGQYGAAQYWIAEASPNLEATPYVHNLVLQFAVDLGWPFALVAVALGGWWALSDLRSRLAEPDVALAWSSLAFLVIHSLLEWPLAHLNFAIIAGLYFALAEPKLKARRLVVEARLLAVAGLAGLLTAVPMMLEYQQLSRTFVQVDRDKAASAHHDDETIGSIISLSESSLLRPYAERLLLNLVKPSPAGLQDQIDMTERVLSRVPDAGAIARLVILHAMAGRFDQSERHLERLRVFAASNYDVYRQVILTELDSLGPAAESLRRRVKG
jgi:O-antigen ligase